MNHTILSYRPEDFSMDPSTSAMLTERRLGLFQPLEISPEAFTKAYELAIGEHVEKNYKGLSYLSWPFAFRYLKEQFPTLFVAFEEASEGWPVFGQEGCWLLRPYITDGIRRTPALVFPIMDNKHNAVKELDARQVSDNIQRASVKCIATFTGLGLKLYSGEDIPKSDDEKATTTSTASTVASSKEATKPAARAGTAAKKVAKDDAPAGTSEPTAVSTSSEFDGKTALLAVCKANPLGFPDDRSSMMAGKAALQHLGLSKGEDIKDASIFADVTTAMVSQWLSKENIKVGKEEMKTAIDKLRAICQEGTVEQAILGITAFVEAKK